MSVHSQPPHELYGPFVEQVLQRTANNARVGITLAVTSPVSGDGVTYVVGGMLQAFRDIIRDRVKVVPLSLIQSELRARLVAFSKGGVMASNKDDYQSEPPITMPPEKADIRRSCLKLFTTNLDIVLIDAPPLSASNDLFGFASLFDGIILVLSAGRTTREQLANAEARLLQAGGTIEGHIFNQRRKPAGHILRS